MVQIHFSRPAKAPAPAYRQAGLPSVLPTLLCGAHGLEGDRLAHQTPRQKPRCAINFTEVRNGWQSALEESWLGASRRSKVEGRELEAVKTGESGMGNAALQKAF